jgi:hypothetical protein
MNKMNKTKTVKINIEQDSVSFDRGNNNEKFNLTVTYNNIGKNSYNITTENNTGNNNSNNTNKMKNDSTFKNQTAIIPTKTKLRQKFKKNKFQKKNNKNIKKVKFVEKVDIIKVECWKQYNLEQTAEETDFFDSYLDDFQYNMSIDDKTKSNTMKNKGDGNSKNKSKKGGKNFNNKNNVKGKGKKVNYTCVCIVI